MNEVLAKLKNQIVVSCQGTEESGNPFYTPEHMVMLAEAAVKGGTVGFRANLPENIKAIREVYPDHVMIGIYKIVEGDNDVYITPNMYSVDSLVDLGCEVIALDATNRKNSRGQYAWEFLKEVKEKYPDQIVMADIATIVDARKAYEAGADIIATTLSGYTEDSQEHSEVANIELIRAIREEFPDTFIIAEGKIWTLDDAQEAFDNGADSIVVGTSINNPLAITKRFIDKEYTHYDD